MSMPVLNNDEEEDSDIEIIENPGSILDDSSFNIQILSEERKKEESYIESERTHIFCTSPIIQIENQIHKVNKKEKTNEGIPNILPTSTKINSTKIKERKLKIKNKFKHDSIDYIKNQLKGVIFSGWVYEREYLDPLKSYRDKIEIDEWEFDLNEKLRAISSSIPGVKEGNKWINITVPSSDSPCFSFWVLLESAPYPGHYWLHVNDVLLDDKFGLKLIVHILRKVHQFDGESAEERKSRMKGGDISIDEWRDWIVAVTNMNMKSVASNALLLLTPSNLSKCFRLTIILSVTLVLALCSFMRESWYFLLRLLRELGIFIHHATPFLQSVIQFIEKLVGGFYLLVAMIFRDIRRPTVDMAPRPPSNMIQHQAPQIAIAPGENSRPRSTYVRPQAWVYKDE